MKRKYRELIQKEAPSDTTVRKRCKRWIENNDKRTPRKKTLKRKRQLSDDGQEALRRALVEDQTNYRGMASSGRMFETRKLDENGSPIIHCPCPGTIRAISREGGQQLSHPKVRAVCKHTPHHKRMRVEFCQRALREGDDWIMDQHHSDEEPLFYCHFLNRKNDVIVVDFGECPNTNIQRIGSVGKHACFSMCWHTSRHGVVCYKLFQENFDMPFYSTLLKELPKPAMERWLEEGKSFSRYVHDGCTGGRNHPYDVLGEVFGEGKFTKHAPPPCKVWTGEYYDVPVRASARRRAHTRRCKVMVDNEECQCNVDEAKTWWPAHSPELNPCENAQNELTRRITKILKEDNGLHWRGPVQVRMQIVERAIADLDADKEYWRKLYASLPGRYRKVVASGGELLDN